MDKKDIYEHLAKIYLDASSKKENKPRKHPGAIVFFIFLGAFFVSGILYAAFHKNNPYSSEISLYLLSDAAKINFNFNPAKKEVFALDLNKLDLLKFEELGFSLKKANPKDEIFLRVEFSNAFKERSEIYFKDIPHTWQDYRVDLSKFRSISDWSEMSNLSFIVEEWNTKEKKGVVYIDNVRLLR